MISFIGDAIQKIGFLVPYLCCTFLLYMIAQKVRTAYHGINEKHLVMMMSAVAAKRDEAMLLRGMDDGCRRIQLVVTGNHVGDNFADFNSEDLTNFHRMPELDQKPKVSKQDGGSFVNRRY